jgi:hypothetical protein
MTKSMAMGISFSFGLTASQAPLMYAIKSYLDTHFVTDPRAPLPSLAC